MSRNFAQAPLMDLVPSLMAKAEVLCHQLERIGTQGSVDVYPWLYRLGLEYICESSAFSQCHLANETSTSHAVSWTRSSANGDGHPSPLVAQLGGFPRELCFDCCVSLFEEAWGKGSIRSYTREVRDSSRVGEGNLPTTIWCSADILSTACKSLLQSARRNPPKGRNGSAG
jgi:hypothetical protein